MNFPQWLRRQHTRHDPVGDLARDFRADKNFPVRMTHITRWVTYLESIGACWAAIEAAEKAWQEFQQAHPTPIGPLSAEARFSILNRDGFRCRYCGATPKDEGVHLEVDHLISLADGGTHQPDNLVTACDQCNRGKSDVIVVDVERLRED